MVGRIVACSARPTFGRNGGHSAPRSLVHGIQKDTERGRSRSVSNAPTSLVRRAADRQTDSSPCSDSKADLFSADRSVGSSAAPSIFAASAHKVSLSEDSSRKNRGGLEIGDHGRASSAARRTLHGPRCSGRRAPSARTPITQRPVSPAPALAFVSESPSRKKIKAGRPGSPIFWMDHQRLRNEIVSLSGQAPRGNPGSPPGHAAHPRPSRVGTRSRLATARAELSPRERLRPGT